MALRWEASLAPGARRAKALRPLALSCVAERQAPLPCCYRDNQVPGGTAASPPRRRECGSSGITQARHPTLPQRRGLGVGATHQAHPSHTKWRCGSASVAVCGACVCVCVSTFAKTRPGIEPGLRGPPRVGGAGRRANATRPARRRRRSPFDRISSVGVSSCTVLRLRCVCEALVATPTCARGTGGVTRGGGLQVSTRFRSASVNPPPPRGTGAGVCTCSNTWSQPPGDQRERSASESEGGWAAPLCTWRRGE